MRHQRPALLLAVLVLLFMPLVGCRPTVPEPDVSLDPAEPGLQFLYIADDGSLVLVDLGTPTGAKITTMTLEPGDGSWHTAASWSPDGKALAIARQVWDGMSNGSLSLHILDLDSGETSVLIEDHDVFGYHSIYWLPGGQHILMEEGTSSHSGLTIFSLDRAEPVRLNALVWYVWSPDGTRIAYCRERWPLERPTPWGEGGTGDVAIYDILTGETTTLFEGTSEYMYYPVAWAAPDSLLVAKMSADHDSSVVYSLHDPQDPNSSPRPVHDLPRHIDRDAVMEIIPVELRLLFSRTSQYAWSADLSHVAFTLSRSPGKAEVWVASADGATACLVATDPLGQRPLWRPGYVK